MVRMDMKWNGKTLFFILACVFFVVTFCYRSYSNMRTVAPCQEEYLPNHLPGLNSDWQSASVKRTLEKTETKGKIIQLSKAIFNAKKHARGSKTLDYLITAVSIMDHILKEIGEVPEEIYRRPSKISNNTCSETFMGGNYGFPLYYEGFVTKTCNNAIPMNNVITVIMFIDLNTNNSHLSSFDEVDKFILSVNDVYKNVSVLIAMDSVTSSSHLKMPYPMVNIMNSRLLTEGSALNKLVEQVTTPYVLVSRNAMALTNDSRLDRLVREIDSLDVVAVGGSFRDLSGHWGKGCFQTAYRNFSLKYVEGYDESFHECVFCDYIQGPFVTRTQTLKENKFQSLNERSGLYEDWFLRQFQKGKEVIVCPDAMFNVHTTLKASSDWKSFLQKWNIHKIVTPEGYRIGSSCDGHKKSNAASLALSPCDLQIHNKLVKLVMKTCEEAGAICELQEGTALGAVKMGKTIPWDLDFDLRFLAINCTICKKLEKAFTRTGLIVDSFSKTCCSKRLQFGERINVGIVNDQGYFGDFTGHAVLDSDLLTKEGLSPTKILYDGQWVNVPRNPGLFVRNRYGKEIYQHAEHWSYTGGKNAHHRMNYTTNRYLPCKYPGRHDCLDRYNGDGSLQFTYLLP